MIYSTQGMHGIVAARPSKHGLMPSFFLVDSYCLGVKDAGFVIDAAPVWMNEKRYRHVIARRVRYARCSARS